MGIMKEIKLYDVVSYAGYKWFVIKMDQDKVTLLAKNDDFGRLRFDRETSDYPNSEIRKHINSVLAKILTKNGAELETVSLQGLADKVFLLSKEEAKELPANIKRFDDWWWLRSPGDGSLFAAYIFTDGDINSYGCSVTYDSGSVRPIISIDRDELLKSSKLEESPNGTVSSKGNDLKVIDFEKKGNVIKFYLGAKDCEDYWGDDWNDCLYDCNAELVYDRFVADTIEVAFPIDCLVVEPCDGELNCRYSKEDMKNRIVPCLVIVPISIYQEKSWKTSYADWVGCDEAIKIYFGDSISVLDGKLEILKPVSEVTIRLA